MVIFQTKGCYNVLKKLISLLLCNALIITFAGCSFNENISEFIGNTIGDGAVSTIEGIVNGKPDDKVITSPYVELPDTPQTQHTPIEKENYYQYSLLNDQEKSLYNTICKGIETQQNYIDVKKFNLNKDNVGDILNLVLADNPQYFWVAKFLKYSITSNDRKSCITHIILFYTDGEVTDDFDNNGDFIATADREKIKQQKIKIDNLATNFLNTISSNTTEIEKERLIHDFVLKTITYAQQESNLELEKTNYLRIYDLYGALANGKAVCEGYAKLFQYLCYQIGINSTFVLGESENENHSWNTVQIDNKWYHVDTTWDDGSVDNIPLYSYFNLTTAQISQTHLIDKTEVNVPTANSTTHSFANTYGVSFSETTNPKNYEAAIDYLIKTNGKYLVLVYTGNSPSYFYIKTHFFNRNCDIQKYIKTKEYNLSFNTRYFEIDNFIYLERI